jgi:hypothetical protein
VPLPEKDEALPFPTVRSAASKPVTASEKTAVTVKALFSGLVAVVARTTVGAVPS